MEKNIQVTNSSIHKFMGKPSHIMPELMKYHSSWSWLMPVVKNIITGRYIKIGDGSERLGLFQAITRHTISINYLLNIELMYQYVVEFIEWHNSQPAPTTSTIKP